MAYNGIKFQVVRYGQNEELKNDTMYFTDEPQQVIERFESLRDLGVIMSEKATFDDHISHITKKVRQRIGWVLRTFYYRRTDFMKNLYKTLLPGRGERGPGV